MQIFLKTLTGRTLLLEVEPTDSIDYIKGWIEENTGLPVEQQGLIYKGNPLKRGRKVSDYNIQPDESIHLILNFDSYKK